MFVFLFVSTQDGTAAAAGSWPEPAAQLASRAVPAAFSNEQSNPQ